MYWRTVSSKASFVPPEQRCVIATATAAEPSSASPDRCVMYASTRAQSAAAQSLSAPLFWCPTYFQSAHPIRRETNAPMGVARIALPLPSAPFSPDSCHGSPAASLASALRVEPPMPRASPDWNHARYLLAAASGL